MVIDLMGHLALHSFGLAAAVVLGAFLLHRWRLQPVRSYHLLVGLLGGAMLLPAAQYGVQTLLPASSPLVPQVVSQWFSAAEELPVKVAAAVADPERAEPRRFESVPTLGPASASLPPRSSATDHLAPLLLLPMEPAYEEIPDIEIEPVAAVSRLQRPERGAILRGLAWVYCAGVLVALARFALRLYRTHGILTRSRSVEDESIQRVWSRVRRTSPIGACTRLRTSDEIQTPACFGLLRQTIVVPNGALELGGDALGLALLHELIHLERRDTWVVLVQELLGCLLWFHPAAWWLKRHLDTLREISCDVIVVRRTGRRRRYAQALLDYADALCRRPRTPAATLLPWTTSPSQLTRRIEMLVSESHTSSARKRTRSVALTVGAFAALWAGQLTLAAHMTTGREGSRVDAPPAPTGLIEPGPTVAVMPTPRPAPLAVMEPARAARGQRADAPEPHDLLFPRADPPEPPKALFARPSAAGPALLAAPMPRVAPAHFQDADRDLHHLGLRMEVPSEALLRHLDTDAHEVLVIRSVIDDSPADEAGLLAWDIIVKVNGEAASKRALTTARKGLTHGDPVELRIIRRGGEKRVIVNPANGGDGWMQGEAPWPEGERASRSAYRRAQEAYERALHQSHESKVRVHEDLRRAQEHLERGPSDRPRILLEGTDGNLAEALERAQRYYKSPDTDELRRHLKMAMKKVHEAQNLFDDRSEYQNIAQMLRDLVQGDLREYVGSVRQYLDQVDPEEFRHEIQEALKKQGFPIHRFQSSDRENELRHLQDELRATRDELRAHQRELAELKGKLEVLSRGGGGR